MDPGIVWGKTGQEKDFLKRSNTLQQKVTRNIVFLFLKIIEQEKEEKEEIKKKVFTLHSVRFK